MTEVSDKRTDLEREMDIAGYVIATDSFMSGWGGAEGGRSLVAVPFVDESDYELVQAHLNERGEMRRVRTASIKADGMPKVRLGKNDHLSVYGLDSFRRWSGASQRGAA